MMIAENVESILKDAGRYVEVKTEIVKLKATRKAAESGSALGSLVIMAVVFLAGLSMLSIGLGFWIGSLIGEVYQGFFIVALFYFVVAIVLYLLRSQLLKTPIYKSIINKLNQ